MERRSREEWRRICAKSHASGLTVREYAEREGVNARTLAWWRSQLRGDRVAEGAVGFVEVVQPRVTVSPTNASKFSVRVGSVAVEMSSLPPVEWLAELASRC